MKGHNYDHCRGDICKKCGKIHVVKSWNKGLTKETDVRVAINAERISEALVGHEVSEQTRQKLSKFRTGKTWEEVMGVEKAKKAKKKLGETLKGRETWQTGHTKETHPGLRKLSDTLKRIGNPAGTKALAKWRKENPELFKQQSREVFQKWRDENPKLSKRISRENFTKWREENPEVFIQHQRRAAIQSCIKQSNSPSSIERYTETFLLDNGVNFEKQVPLFNTCVTDFYIPEYNTAIFCDGCYWHACPEHCSNSIPHIRERDKFVTDFLTGKGFGVIRSWEHEILENDFSKLEGIL